MTVRFLSNLFVMITGALLLAACFAFRPPTLGWLAFAAGCSVLIVTLCAFPVRGRGPRQRALDVAVAVLAAWTLLAARAFLGGTLKWVSVAEAFALLGLGAGGLLSGHLELRSALALGAFGPRGERHPRTTAGPSGRRGEHPVGERGRL